MKTTPALERLKNATLGSPYEGELWLVGGWVRDQLLGLNRTADIDLVCEHDAALLAEWLWNQGVSSIAPVVYPRFGTAMVQVLGEDIEIVTARRESYEQDSRKPHVEPATLFEDAQRRDFTVNALQQNLHSGEIVDRLGRGLADLQARVLRTPKEPGVTLRDDPLRILRAVRFRGQLGFDYVPELREALLAESAQLAKISAERQRDEWGKMLSLLRAADCMRDCMELGICEVLWPEFVAMVGVEQGDFHHLDVWEHSLLVLENARSTDLMLNLACLLHDIGKPATRFVDANGSVRFFGHETVGAELCQGLLTRFRFPNELIDQVVKLVKNHMRLGSSPQFSDAAARRVLRDLGASTESLVQLVEADIQSLKPGIKTMDLHTIRQVLKRVQAVTPAATLRSPLTGAEVMETIGVSSGPIVGLAQNYLTELVLEGTLGPEAKEEAKKWLSEWFATNRIQS